MSGDSPRRGAVVAPQAVLDPRPPVVQFAGAGSDGPAPASCPELATEIAPPFVALLGAAGTGARTGEFPAVGQAIDDFELLQLLGEGSFGKVFLARQVSLNRLVALKVTANRGSEAQALAILEHDHIVRVFSETIDRQRDLRLLCMQYVAGTTLERVLDILGREERTGWAGRHVLEVIDRLSIYPTIFHPAALRDRELLADADHVQAVCRIGTQLAEALDYAHSQGVLHRDIKPANILLSPYGRALLADFSLSFRGCLDDETASRMLGGTLAYMAPEHLDAFNPAEALSAAAVDQRSDLYSLGVVLFEMLTGRRPFALRDLDGDPAETLREMAADRRGAPPSSRALLPEVPRVLDRVLRRCLDPQPERRYQTGLDLARALDGCHELQQVEQYLPAPGPVARRALAHPFRWVVILALLPQVLGSIVNMSYNALYIIDGLTAAQQAVFFHLVLGYNAVVYPLCLAITYRMLAPAIRNWRALADVPDLDSARVDAARRNVLTWPQKVVALSCLGWLPGGLLFPVGIAVLSGPVGIDVFGHFLVSFTISGLIALTYSFFAVQFIVLRVLYPRLWLDAPQLRLTAGAELAALEPRLRLFQFLAGVIPLAGAILMVGVGAEVSGDRMFRLLVTGLICISMLGFGLAILVNKLLFQTLRVLTHPDRRRPITAGRRTDSASEISSSTPPSLHDQ